MHVRDDPRVGTELAGYRIHALLGWGGMSVVYVADDLRLKRRVALKLLAPELADDAGFRERFLLESELAASIDHPNIVPIYEAGAAAGRLFIAMRLVEGLDLAERLRRGSLDLPDAVGIIAQLASALDAAHARGLVHRDVKPSNVLLDPGARPDGSDHVYLADFGLTRPVTDDVGVDDGRALGTIDYVAPEQIAGDAVTGRADVYSLGCVLYECLVGQPPFGRDSELAVAFAHLESEPPAASSHRPELSAALDRVIDRALAKSPEERYATCRELAQAALAVVVDEARRRLLDVASRAAPGRSDLSDVEAELAGTVIDLQLVREQARALSGSATPSRVAADGVCPFKGLASFEPADADYYFGRERLVADLVARVVGGGFLGIVGPSGSGKSSVLRAGLLPALAGGMLPGSGGWRRLLLRPGAHPLDELRRVLVTGAPDALGEALHTLPAGARLLLAVDQLEELFTECRSDAERGGFADALVRAANDPAGRALVVVALRADFYGRIAAFPGLADLLGSNQVLVPPMQASELRRAVALPAGRVGLRVEPELVDALVDDVEGEPGALPLLSTALFELWQRRDADVLTLAAYLESGGVRGAVARLAEGTYAAIPDGRKPIVRALMLRLVDDGEAAMPVRRRAPLAELDLQHNQAADDVLSRLAESRLVTVGDGSVEVAHESLLREWPRLRAWIDEDADGRRLRRHITQAAREWETAGRDRSELYRGARLAAAVDWTAEHALDVNELERAFVAASIEASERDTRSIRRTNRRLRGLLLGVAVLLAVAVAGGVLAVVQRGQARDAETGQLAQRLGAQALVEDDLDLSLLLARQAVATDNVPQTRGYLLSDLLRAPAVAGIMHGEGDILRAVAVSPEGATLVVGDFYTGLLFFDARTFERLGEPLAVSDWVESIAYSPDGRRLAYGGKGYARVIDARTRQQLAATRIGPEDDGADAGTVMRVAFTEDGSRLVVVVKGTDETVSIGVRDAATLAPVGSPIGAADLAGAYVGSFFAPPGFALTPDGRFAIVSAGGAVVWWDLSRRVRVRRLPVAAGARALALSADGRTAVVGVDDGIRFVDTKTGGVRAPSTARAEAPSWVVFSPDARTVASTGLDGSVTIWDVATATVRETLRGHSRAVSQPVFSPDGATLYTVSHDGTAIAWDLTGRRRLGRPFAFTHDRTFDERGFDGHPGAFSPDGRLVAVGLKEHGISLRSVEDPAPSGRLLQATGGQVWALAFAPNGRTLAAVTVEGRATIWDVARGSLRRKPFTVGPQFVLGVTLSADGSTLAAPGPDGVTVWDVATGAAQGTIGRGIAAGGAVFAPRGSILAFVHEHGGSVELWDAERLERVGTLAVDNESTYYAIAFSPDGRAIATGSLDDPVVRVWDVGTGRLVRELDQGGATVMTLDFNPDASILAVSSFEPTASLWDVATGARIGPTLTAGSRRAEIDVSPDGRTLLLTHGDGRGALWDIDPESWARRACMLANRTLTREEWATFLPGRPYEPSCAG